MNKKKISLMAIVAILVVALLALTGCTSEDESIDTSLLSFSPVGVWVDISDGEKLFEAFANGKLDCGDEDLYTWTVVGEDLINVDLDENGDYDLGLFQLLGYNLIGNEYATFCLEDDYENAHTEVYLPLMSEEMND
ncbi:MAG: hypothetical protein IKP28_00520 [Clostridia bacterium]|nr:hypothetical protein [Clostridia bacterium]